MKILSLSILIFCWNIAFSQVDEKFTDGNFTVNPAWSGSNSNNDFTIIANQLRSASTTGSSNFYLSTANTLANNCTWEFWCNLQFSTSGSNYVDVYLISDQADLQSANINGYFVRIGNTEDEISLYKRSGAKTTSVKIIDGVNSSVNTSNNTAKIKVTRTSANLFTLERDLTGTGSSYFTEGTISDAQITTSSHFGVFIQQSTTGFHQKHFFDDFKIESLNIDNAPPQLVSAKAIDSLIVEATFNEPLDSVTAKVTSNYTLSGHGNPSSITRINPSVYRLHYTTSLQTNSYTLTVTNVKDLNGNVISGNNSVQFNFVKPYIAKKNDVAINEIFADPSPQVDLPGLEFIELWNTSNKTINLRDWKYSDFTTSFTFGGDSIQPNEYLILCARADTLEFKRFGRVIGISPWPSLNNSSDNIKLISDKNSIINEITYSDTWYKDVGKKLGGWTLERIDPLSKCEGIFNWSASGNISGGTPGKVNSIYQKDYDLIPLKADSITQVSDSTVKIFLNKPLDQSTATADKFSISPAFAQLKTFTFDTEVKQVTLTYSKKFTAATEFTLTIASVRDCSGNEISSVNQPLKFTTAALPIPPPVRLDTAKIIINEIFADPSPEVGLPLAEFVEIYNPGNETVDLEGWSWSDPTAKAVFKKNLILPKQYLILCPAADTVHYKQYGKVIGLSPWPSLNNSSDQIVLKSFKNRTVDSVSYSDTWYKDAGKKVGGWTLERIDALSKCEGIAAWSASKDITGGTPGKVNSVYIKDYDLQDFHADSLKKLSDTTIAIFFNKALDQSSVSLDKFIINPSAVGSSLFIDTDLQQVRLTYKQRFLPETTYSITIQSVKDCSGNEISNINQPLKFTTAALPIPPPIQLDTAKIIINEIFADPSPEVGLPLAEFVEIYNPGNETVDLEGWSWSDPTAKAVFKKNLILPKQYLILCPAADTVHYKQYGKVIGLSPWPSLNNSSDQIVLKSFKNRTVDSVSYTDTWYKDAGKKQGGWTLERIDPLSKCEGIFNWSASGNISGGTPGKVNSIYQKDYDLLTFKTDSFKKLSDTTITIFLNKIPDQSTLTIDKFILSPSSAKVKSLDNSTDLRQVTLTFNQKFLSGTTYSLTIQGLKDCSGNEISSVNQPLKFTTAALPIPPPVRPDTAKIIINEIFADPSPEVGLPLAEFVEIYNPGNETVDLEGWSWSDPTAKAVFKKNLILPKQYLILCPAADTIHYKQYGKVIGLSPWPSLNNSSDQIVLKSFKNRTVDSVSYSDTWYKDAGKKQGGWTLERIDPLSKCEGIAAWSDSKDISGGTPGKVNSIYQKDYDLLTFKTDSFKKLSDTTITIFLKKIPDQSTLTIDKFILSPSSAKVKSLDNSPDLRQVTLTFNQKFLSGTTYSLTIQGLKDCSGNEISSINQPLKFTTAALPIPPPVRLDTAKIIINEIFADPSPEVGLPLAEFVEIYNPGNETVDLEGWSWSDPTAKAVFKKNLILPKQYLILCPAADTIHYKQYGKVVGLSPWPSLNNSSDQIVLKTFKNRTVDSVSYSDTWYKDAGKKVGGWTLERIDPLSKCEGIAAWSDSKDISGGTPGKANSIYQKDYDLLTFKTDSFKKLSDTTITIFLNKIPDQSTLTIDKFILSPSSATVKSLDNSTDLRQVTLTFNQKFLSGTTYSLTIQGLKDCSGNEISSVNQPLKFTTAALPIPPPVRLDTAKIIINEIFADPSPEVGLPLAEFVEIYNPGNETVDLEGWSWSDPTAKAVFKKNLILPKQYLILCPAADTIHYKQYGKVIGLSPWPSLNNSSDQIVLKSFKNRTVDSVSYTDTWYKDAGKKVGGWTLERIDPLSKCTSIAAWSDSKDISGGSPGKVNSIYQKDYDLIPLKADSITQVSDSTVKIFLNKPLDQSTATADKFSISPAFAQLKTFTFDTEVKQVTLTYSKKFTAATEFTLTIASVRDCSGNEISSVNQPLKFTTAALPIPPPVRLDTAKIIINEIFADPSPEVGLPLAEFVEIYNPGNDKVDLEGWSWSDPTAKAVFKKNLILPKQYLILCPAADTVHYKQYGKVIGLSPWPSLNNSSDQIVLKSFKNRTVDSVSYSDTWYKDAGKKQGGWTLERMAESPCIGWYNWDASYDLSGGTPGKINSSNNRGSKNLNLKIDSILVISESTLRVYFNTIQDTVFLRPNNFKLNGIQALSVKTSEKFLSIELTFKDHFIEGTTYTLITQELRTCSGSLITQPDNQITFTTPAIPELNYPIVINEIFADPSPVVGMPEAEFVELFNPTDKTIALKGLIYEDALTKYVFPSGRIEPGGYLILCALKDTLSFKPFGNVYGLANWPSLNNDKDILTLRNNKGKAISSINYESGWHRDKNKQSGGWSLELIDLNAVCSGKQNWSSSTHTSGGTPGKQNSIYKTNFSNEALKLSTGFLIDSVTLQLTFNRTIDSLSASRVTNYSLNNGIGKPMQATVLDPDFTQVNLKFQNALIRRNTYKISVTDVTDCAGISISANNNSTEFFFPKRLEKGDILINEILFNPRKNGADFVEIYNNSANNFDLKDLAIATYKDSLTSIKPLSLLTQLIKSGEYLVLTTDPDNIKKEYVFEKPDAFLKMQSMPAFNDDAGVIVLLSHGIRIDELIYTDKMHYKLIKDPEGVSLERSSFSKATNEPDNFRSATASAGYATPGYKNSQFIEEVISEEEVFLSSKTFSPDSDGFEDVLTLNYKFNEPGWIANVTIYNDKGVLIKKLTKNHSLAANGTIYWDGLNEFNEKPQVGIYVLYMEVFNLQGKVKKYRRSFVLAAKLN